MKCLSLYINTAEEIRQSVSCARYPTAGVDARCRLYLRSLGCIEAHPDSRNSGWLLRNRYQCAGAGLPIFRDGESVVARRQ
jgi:hypothetical protein